MSPRREKKMRVERLRQLSVFAGCPEAEVARVEHLGSQVRVKAGERLVRENTVGMECMIVLEGNARVTRDGVEIAGIGPGSIVGELALITHKFRNADVTAVSDMVVLVLDPSEFAQMTADAPSMKTVIDRAVAERNVPAS